MAKKRMYRRPDGLYEKSVSINGIRKRFRGRTEKEVMRKIVAYEGEISKGLRFGAILEAYESDFLEEHPSSYRYIKSHLRRLRASLGEYYAKDLTPRDFTIFFATLDGLSYKTVASCKSVASCRYNFRIRRGELEENPVEKAKIPSHLKKGRRDMPTEEEIERIKNSREVPDALLFLTALYSGMRRGELLRLQFKDIDRDNNVIHVRKSVYYVDNAPMIKEPKTERGSRDVVLLEPLRKVLPEGNPNDFVFGGSQPWTAKLVQNKIDRYRRAVGIKCSLHQLRHAYRTILYEAGIDERMRMDLLGHRNIRTTRDIYTHISRAKRQQTLDRLNEYLATANTTDDTKT